MLHLVVVLGIDVSKESCSSIIRIERISKLGTQQQPATDSFHHDDGGKTFLRIVGSYKSHTALNPKTAFLTATALKISNLT
jgi:hypothetical protein